MSPIVLSDHDVGEPQPASIADQHVQASRNRLVGHYDPVRVKRFAELCGFRARGGAHVQREHVLLVVQQANR